MSNRADPPAVRLADRHYSRKTPGSPQFAPTGSCVVFLSDCGRAYWVTSVPFVRYVKHAWAGAWLCSAFRSEGAGEASTLIRQAVAATVAHYGLPPSLGMITMINRKKVRPTRVRGRDVYGWTFLKAGFVDAGETKSGLLVLQLWPEAMPAAFPAKARSVIGLPLFGYPG